MSEARAENHEGVDDAHIWCLQRRMPWLPLDGSEACRRRYEEHRDLARAIRTIHEHVGKVRPKGVEDELSDALRNYTTSVLVHRGLLDPTSEDGKGCISTLARGDVPEKVGERLAYIQKRVLGILRCHWQRSRASFATWVKAEECWTELKRGGPLEHGIVCDDRWGDPNLRILWLLKEPNYAGDVPGNLCKWLGDIAEQGFKGRFKHFKSTWLRVARTTWALSSQPGVIRDDHHSSLGNIAVVNLVKTGGTAKADPKYLGALAKRPEYWRRVLSDVEAAQPELVVAGNVLNWFPAESGVRLPAPKVKSNDPFPSTSSHGAVWVNALHPCYPYSTTKYVARIFESWRTRCP